MKHATLIIVGNLVLGTLFFLAPARAAFAASGTPHEAAVVTCSKNGCNNLDPYQTGCASGGYKRVAAVSDLWVRVELEYSFTCGTNWTQVYRLDGHVGYAAGCVARQPGPDGGPLSTCYHSNQYAWINTNQVWAPDNVAQACGNGGIGMGVCTNWY